MKYISVANTISFYYLWQEESFKKEVTNLINKIINKNESYNLLNFYNKEINHVRSYLLFESCNHIVMIDFNYYHNNHLLLADLDIINYLKISSKKEVIYIMFNLFKDNNYMQDNFFSISINNQNNNFINFLLSHNYTEQCKYSYQRILNVLYNLDNEFLIKYNNEIKLISKISGE